MREILGVIILAVGSGATLAILLTVLTYLLPGHVQRAQIILETSAKRAFVIGLVNFMFFGLIAAFGAERSGPLGLIAGLIALALLGLSAIGLTAVNQLLRQRIYDSHTVNATLKTAVLLIAAGLTPIIGWFILTPLTIMTGLGAIIITLFRSPKKDPATDNADSLPY